MGVPVEWSPVPALSESGAYGESTPTKYLACNNTGELEKFLLSGQVKKLFVHRKLSCTSNENMQERSS